MSNRKTQKIIVYVMVGAMLISGLGMGLTMFAGM
ncbi:stressosome-associated protein Prli42 [Sporosarcina sp. CAU 1771]